MLPQSMQDGESALTEKAILWPVKSGAAEAPLPGVAATPIACRCRGRDDA